ncbi:hypothetical protein K474DRAFT_1712834 [Panus rudis PR-1116 ss-1]|nr:hypothetical protein K474DRAFT_1712834 [Panus rudis PR-1116 ss-1]
MSFLCFACRAQYKTKTALTNHRRSCGASQALHKKSLQELNKRGFRRFPRTSSIEQRKERIELQNTRLSLSRSRDAEGPVESVTGPSRLRLLADELPEESGGSSSNPQETIEELPESRSRVGRQRRPPKLPKDFIPYGRTRGLPKHIPIPAKVPPVTRLSTPSDADSHDAPPDSENVPMDETSKNAKDDPPAYYETLPDKFGVVRCYPVRPRTNPEDLITLDDLCDAPTLMKSSRSRHSQSSAPSGFRKRLEKEQTNPFTPFNNATEFLFIDWKETGSSLKTVPECQRVVDLMENPDFNVEDLRGFNVAQALDKLDGTSILGDAFDPEDGWRIGHVDISLPCERVKNKSEEDALTLRVDGIHYRKLTHIITEAFKDPSAENFHYVPFREYWRRERHSQADSGLFTSDTSTTSDTGDSDYDFHSSSSSSRQPTCEDVPDDDDDEDIRDEDDDGAEYIRMYSEIYNSDAMLEEDAKLRAQPRNPDDGPEVEYAIAALLAYSDSTRLANFGKASLWPIYIFFGNQSKYYRGKPSCFAAHHLAYLPTLPDDFQDFYQLWFGEPASEATLRFCRRELFQGVWLLLLDEDFMHAYVHGILIRCADGVLRRLFPRFFCYLADYPEKVLIACIRFLAQCPCPRCYIQMKYVPALATTVDFQRRKHIRVDNKDVQALIELTRRWIFEGGISAGSKKIMKRLESTSLLPHRSAFSTRLAKYGLNVYALLVPDLLHAFELGVWKGTYTHLLRILYAQGQNTIQEFNARFRQVPTFGRDTIRRFRRNMSDEKGLAARDYEDILQCIIPVFEGLLPEPHNEIIMKLLFTLATWHALAKLRLHTEKTLAFFEDTTRLLGTQVRQFSKVTCASYETRELPREATARKRRAALTGKQGTETTGGSNDGTVRKLKYFNLETSKWHDLPDFVKAIREFGTTDNTSTEKGELEHRRPKSFWPLIHKGKHVAQIAKRQARQRKLNRIRDRLIQSSAITLGSAKRPRKKIRLDNKASVPPSQGPRTIRFEDSDPLPPTAPQLRYHISNETRYFVEIRQWLPDYARDPAYKGFMFDLKNHILMRLSGRSEYDNEMTFTDKQRASVRFESERLYQHKVLRVNYTTYDMRRAQDSINPRTHPFIMLYSPDPKSKHPYWYAQVIHIFHADVKRAKDQEFTRMDFLWVRWFGVDDSSPGGFKSQRLHSLGFIESTGDGPFGFVDPKYVIRACHLIPDFARGRTTELLGPSSIRKEDDDDEDWDGYYVNMHVDRDMFMRYLGGGVGHAESEELRAQEPPQLNSSEINSDASELEQPDEPQQKVDQTPGTGWDETIDAPDFDPGVDAEDEDEEDEGEPTLEDDDSDFVDEDEPEDDMQDPDKPEDTGQETDDDDLGPEDGEEELDDDEQDNYE